MARTFEITLDDERASRAEELAAARGITLPELTIRLLGVLTDPPVPREELAPHTRAAHGLLKDVPDRPYKELLEEAILEKHGRTS